MNLKKFFFSDILIVLIIFLLDRISKLYVIHLDGTLLNSEIITSKLINIHLIWNEGVAFGLLSFNEELFYNILTFVIAIICLVIIFEIKKNRSFKKYSLVMVLGGAFGNLFDRLIYNAVPDFIDFHVGNFHWFIFNVADVFISLGIIFLIYNELFVIKKKYD